MRLFFLGPRILGIRPGISVGPQDFGGGGKVEGSFLYVVSGRRGPIKIGVTTNPRERLASLQTASPSLLEYRYLAATPGTGFDIEATAHTLLQSRRMAGEWFNAPWGAGALAIRSAASGLAQPLLDVTLEQSDRILAVASQQNPQKNWFKLAFVILASAIGLSSIFR